MELNLHQDGETLDPLTYSNGKTQTDVVAEVLEAFEDDDVVWLDGKVGSGKSVISIRTALEFGRGLISTPTKVLSEQYREDYSEGKKYFEKENGTRAEIAVFKGRRNFECPYLKKGLYAGTRDPEPWKINCQNPDLPCTRTLYENESRIEALSKCKWGGTIRRANEDRSIERSFELDEKYRGVGGKERVLSDGCPYWNQYEAYASADVMVMNSMKFKIEARLGRLPGVPFVSIDEADTFLDNLSTKVALSREVIDRVQKNVKREFEGRDREERIEEIEEVWKEAQYTKELSEFLSVVEKLKDKVENVRRERSLSLRLESILEYEDSVEVINRLDEGENPKVIFVIANPKEVVRDLIDTLDAKVLLMSATQPSDFVLENIFGLNPASVQGEPKFPGTIVQKITGKESKVTYKKWKTTRFREEYTQLRSDILRSATRPVFSPVHATKYLPPEVQSLTDKEKEKLDGVTYSTKMDRGIDLPEKESIVLLKYPRPYLGDPLLQAMKNKLGEDKFWAYYGDVARRDFIQQIGRILRNPECRKEFWSPDATCHEKLDEVWDGDIDVEKLYC